MALLKRLKSIFKKSKKKPAASAKRKQAGPPQSKGLSGKPIKKPAVKRGHFGEAYKILKEPHISEKATILTEQNKYIFKVYPDANKIETKKAVENLYGVRVKNVNMINIPKKRKVIRGIKGTKSGYKKAIVTLEKGYKIELLPH